MQITLCWMQAHFERFNTDYFGGELPTPKFSVNNARTCLGTMIRRCRHKSGIRTCYDYTIRMSNYYDIPEREFQNVLLHEMIHLYIAVKSLKDTSSHGTVFRTIMRRLNSYGWNIAVRTNTDNWDVAASNIKNNKTYTVLAVITSSGRYMLSVVNPAYIESVERAVSFSNDVRKYSWHTSTDHYFSTYRCVRTPRGRIVSRQDFEEKLAGMHPL